MARKRNGWVPVGEVFGGLDGPVKAHRDTSPQARHHFTQADQVNHLATAHEADPDLGFMRVATRLLLKYNIRPVGPYVQLGTIFRASMKW